MNTPVQTPVSTPEKVTPKNNIFPIALPRNSSPPRVVRPLFVAVPKNHASNGGA